MEILSSFVISFEFRLGLWLWSPFGIGGEDEGPGDMDFWREDLFDCLEGVLYGVSVGVGREA